MCVCEVAWCDWVNVLGRGVEWGWTGRCCMQRWVEPLVRSCRRYMAARCGWCSQAMTTRGAVHEDAPHGCRWMSWVGVGGRWLHSLRPSFSGSACARIVKVPLASLLSSSSSSSDRRRHLRLSHLQRHLLVGDALGVVVEDLLDALETIAILRAVLRTQNSRHLRLNRRKLAQLEKRKEEQQNKGAQSEGLGRHSCIWSSLPWRLSRHVHAFVWCWP